MAIAKQLLCLLILISTIYGCGEPAGSEKEVIATVNGEAIFVEDLNRAIALQARNNPLYKISPSTLNDELDIILNRRLLVQKAKEKKLDETPKFMDTIKTFWEQTLIRDLMDNKNKELERDIEITDEDIRDYYNKLSYRVTFNVVKKEYKNIIDILLKRQPREIKWDEIIGPITYEDITSHILQKAFGVPEGKRAVFKDDRYYYLIYIEKKERLDLGPYDEIKDDIRGKIAGERKEKALSAWLDEAKEESEIKIHHDVLEKLKYRYD